MSLAVAIRPQGVVRALVRRVSPSVRVGLVPALPPGMGMGMGTGTGTGALRGRA